MASVSGMLRATIAVPPPLTHAPGLSSSSSAYLRRWGGCENGGGAAGSGVAGPAGLVVECSSRPQKKGTAHHMKTRPKKSQPWDIRRKGPTVYPPLPTLPPDWTLVAAGSVPEESPKQEEEEEEEEVFAVAAA